MQLNYWKTKLETNMKNSGAVTKQSFDKLYLMQYEVRELLYTLKRLLYLQRKKELQK